MINITIRSTITDEAIQGLYQLYLHKNGGARGTKKDFMEYIRSQVAMFGTDTDSLLSVNEYEELTEDDLNLLMKWRLI